jgi:hypothetical protein
MIIVDFFIALIKFGGGGGGGDQFGGETSPVLPQSLSAFL